MNFFINSIVVLLLTLLFCFITQMDIRSTNSIDVISRDGHIGLVYRRIIIVATFWNVPFFPLVIADSLYNDILNEDESRVFGLFMVNDIV